MRNVIRVMTFMLALAATVTGFGTPTDRQNHSGSVAAPAARLKPVQSLRRRPAPGVETPTLPPFCAGPLQVQGVAAYVCEFPVNWVFAEADLAPFATTEFGVTIQAVGGNGGDGGSALSGTFGGGSGGQPGLAQATLRGDALAGQSLYIYVGNNGSFGASGKGGSGGAATVVATAPLSPQPGNLDSILVAAGGGGGGQGYGGAQPTCLEVPLPASISDAVFVSCAGGNGGVAIGIDAQNRSGFAGLGATPPVAYILANGANCDPDSELYQCVANLGAGQPARFDAGAWVAGAGGSGGSVGSAAFSFAGAPGADSPETWVRETATLTLGTSTVLGGQGTGTGGGGGGGVAGGGGAGNAGGAGGASYAVGSGYGLTEGDALTVPCEAEGFCARNWLSPADTDQPTVVITFWESGGADPLIPTDGATIDTDQPSLVFNGGDASAGIHYILTNALGELVNYSGLINGSATGNLLWTVPGGLLDAGQTYNWSVTDQAGNVLQDPRSYTLATSTTASGLGQGWTLYIRSMDTLDTGLSASLRPLSNQLVPQVNTSCQCTCEESSLAGVGSASFAESNATLLGSTYPTCGGYVSKAYCNCTWNASGANPAASTYWNWNLDTGTDCQASSGSCYANAQVQSGTIDFDWASPSNPLGLQVPPRLINLTSEPPSPANGTSVPSLAVPAITGYSGSCADSSQVQLTFTARTNGGLRFQVYADPTSGAPASSPATAIDYWNIPNCSWSGASSQPSGATGGNQAYSNEYMAAEVYKICQASVTEQTGSQSFCLTPGTRYRVRFDGMQPYLPGPMELGFKLPGMASGAPIPANWISTCALDGTTNNCDTALVTPPRQRRGRRPPGHAGPQAQKLPLAQVTRSAKSGRPARSGPSDHMGGPATHGRGGPTGVDASLLTVETGTAGAESCNAAGSTVSCTWTANGTWELPASLTQPGGWITVQAVGGAGGAGDPATSNPGGLAGRAQAVLPAGSLSGMTLYAYVGENGADIYGDGIDPVANGGGASLVTISPIPSSVVSSGCKATPEAIDALVIAGGGGGGSIASGNNTSASGGSGGIAVGGSGVQQTIGSGSPGGQGGGAWGGRSPTYGSNPYNGTDSVSGGASATPDNGAVGPGSGAFALGGGGVLAGDPDFTTQTASWMKNTSYLTLGKPSSTTVCGGGTSIWVGGAGGGGHAAGGSGTPVNGYTGSPGYPAGGGGGSSWATGAGAGVTLPAALTGWQTLSTNDPSQVVITVDCPYCVYSSECAMAASPLRPVMRCTFTNSVQPLSASNLGTAVGALIGQDIGDQVPVYVEAWGGFGGPAGPLTGNCSGASGGSWGTPGYARSSHTFGDFSQAFASAWLYIGAGGAQGPWADNCSSGIGAPGAGGAATLVLSAPLSETTTIQDLLVAAGGGGGGGQGNCSEFCYSGYTARQGGQAVATTAGSANASGEGQSGGGDGIGGCDPGGKPCGEDGIGGLGGSLGSGVPTGWVGLSSEWSHGQGGQTPGGGGGGGAGGGGYGGGGVGSIDSGHFAGGGAGGSYAAQATLNDTGAPVLGPDGYPSSTNGVVVISFDVCSAYPNLEVCQQ